MTFNRQDWLALRYPLVIFGIALILATLLVSFAEEHKSAAAQALQSQQNQLNQARQRYQASGEEKKTITDYLPQYQKLINDGFIGEEHRIEWVDSLRTIHQQYKLFSISYSIGTQQEYATPGFAVSPAPFKLERSVMKLELPLLHEGDLLTLLDALQQTQRTPVIPRQCEISRLAATFNKTVTPNLHAVCELDWLTLREPQYSGATP